MRLIIFIFFLLIDVVVYKNKKKKLEKDILRFIKRCKKFDLKNKDNNLISILNYTRLMKRKQIQLFVNYSYEIEPKITFISSVYNKEKYIDVLILSIQALELKEIEVIFIDDCSNDKSINIINQFKKNDNRIKLIKNKENKGTLYSRSIGAINSKGEYIIFIDSDDIIISNGILNAYRYISDKNISMIQYNSLIQKKDFITINKQYEKFKNIIYQPFLSYIFYFNGSTCFERNTALWDKIIRREVVINSIFFIGKKYIHKNIIIENDVILLYSFLQNSESYLYINDFGYYYIRTHNESISNNWLDPKIADKIIESILNTVDFLYEKSGNTNFNKRFSVFKLRQSFDRYKDCFKLSKNVDKLIKDLFDKLLNSNFISNKDKLIIMNIETEIAFLKGNEKYLFRKQI